MVSKDVIFKGMIHLWKPKPVSDLFQ